MVRVRALTAYVVMSRDEWEYGYDDTLDRILGQTTALLSLRGDQQAVALLLDVSSLTIAQTDEVREWMATTLVRG